MCSSDLLDLVGIQMNAGSPAAKAYATLQDWIVGATFNGCSGAAKVTCRFSKDGTKFTVVWPEKGAKTFATAKAREICSLDGTCTAVKGKKITVTSPVKLS